MGKNSKQGDTAHAVTMRDVARKSGFSPTTVSITLNDAPLARHLPAETKARIKQAARDLGYRPNPFARSLISRRSHTVGVMVFDVTDPYCTMILRGIEQKLFESSYVSVLTDARNESPRFERYLEMLLDRRVEGLIVIANWSFLDIDLLNDLVNHPIPAVVIGSSLERSRVSSVDISNMQGAYSALEYLYELGHRKIAFIRGPQPLSDTSPRWKGIVSFAETAHLEIDTELVMDLDECNLPYSSFDGGYRLARALLCGGRRFTAVMGFDDLSALGAMRALDEAGIRIPEQCSVMGFDDIPTASVATPALTTMRQPMESMGSTGASILLDQIAAYRERRVVEPVRQILNLELVVRNSTAAAGLEMRSLQAGS